MCFPTLKQTRCCCSLKTGMSFICCIGIAWNSITLFNGSAKTDPPDFLKFLDTHYSLSYGHHFVDYSQLYYAIQIFAMIFAFFGTALDSLCCLLPLVVSETFILLMYFLKILTYLLNSWNYIESKEDPLGLFILFVYHYYACAIIFSFYSQVSKGEDGREHGITGVIITTSTQTASSPSASAPCPNDQNFPSVSYANSLYATQPPYAPVVTHGEPCLSMYPSNEYAQTAMPSAPCYMPQPVGMNEKPPPYAP